MTSTWKKPATSAVLFSIPRQRSRFVPAIIVGLAALHFFAPHGLAQVSETKASSTLNSEVFSEYAVAADHPLASAAGAEVLAQGGSAADAAAATMLALGVVSPASSGLGGGGFALYYDAETKKLTFFDFREMAPAAATKDMFKDQKDGEGPLSVPSMYGGLASGVPGEAAGIEAMLEKYGKISRGKVVAPAIAYAQKGFAVSENFAKAAKSFAAQMKKDPVMASWFKKGTDEIKAGQKLRNPQLARTLRLLAASGAKAFYRGALAREIARQNKKWGGVMTEKDLANYKVAEREPVSATLAGFRWVGAPPPSAGGYTMLSSLRLLESWIPTSQRKQGGAPLFHAFAESWKGPYLDRATYLGDPDFVEIPFAKLSADARVAIRDGQYRPALAMEPQIFDQPLDPGDRRIAQPDNPGTSHLCVVDKAGNVASITTTVNLPFGARYTAGGMVMNDEMDDFASDAGAPNAFGLPGGIPNLPEPGKRPMSSMSPTIVFDGEGRPVFCGGASGGSRIITATQQVAWNTLVRGVPLKEAIAAPRVHHQGLPNTLRVEEFATPPKETLDALVARGHKIEMVYNNANVQAIHIIYKDGKRLLHAASDPRKGGSPAGK